jgi:hypothetical protein
LRDLQLILIHWRKDFSDLVISEIQVPIRDLSFCDEALRLLGIWPGLARRILGVHVLGFSMTG